MSIRWPFFAVLVCAAIPFFEKVFQVYAAGLGTQMFPHLRLPWGITDGLFYDLISREIFFAVLMLLVTGAGQIADDLRSGALQIYFGKPIRQIDYVLGKFAATFASALFVTLVPALLLLAVCAAFAPDFTFLTGNPLLPLRILGFSGLVSLSLAALVLALSSVARNGRSVGLIFAGGYFLTMGSRGSSTGCSRTTGSPPSTSGSASTPRGGRCSSRGPPPRPPRTSPWACCSRSSSSRSSCSRGA